MASTALTTSDGGPSLASAKGQPSDRVPSSVTGSAVNFDKLELLLSLDVALELIHADREALKRLETFSAYPGRYGYRVRDTMEEIFVLMLQALGDRHIRPGFER